MIKGNAYGHGLLPIARTAIAEGITRIGVLETATGSSCAGGHRTRSIALRLAARPGRGLPRRNRGRHRSRDLRYQPTGRDRSKRCPRAGALHLKIDTGLHRNGVTEENWPALVRAALALEAAGKARLCAAWTHIAEASEAEDSAALRGSRRPSGWGSSSVRNSRFGTSRQRGRVCQGGLPLRHRAHGRVHASASRRAAASRPTELGLVPVMTLTTRVAATGHGRVRRDPAGVCAGRAKRRPAAPCRSRSAACGIRSSRWSGITP